MGKHLIGNKKLEILYGTILFAVGGILLWDAFDNRGKKVPWPLSILMPW